MRVCLVAHPRIGLNRGGLQIQIEETAAALVAHGLDVQWWNPWDPRFSDSEIVHIFSTDPALADIAVAAKSAGARVVLSPVLSQFSSSARQVAWKYRLARTIRGYYTDLRKGECLIRAADVLVALTPAEKSLLAKCFLLADDSIQIVPNGVDTIFGSVEPTHFQSLHNVVRFVLHVGSFTPIKNQLFLIRAMNGSKRPLVLVGGPTAADSSYLEKCKREAQSNVHFVGRLEEKSKALASCYAAAEVFVLVSKSEVHPLVLLEAAASGCEIVVPDHLDLGEPLGKPVVSYRRNDPESLCESIEVAYLQDQRFEPKHSSWAEVAAKLVKIYEGTL